MTIEVTTQDGGTEFRVLKRNIHAKTTRACLKHIQLLHSGLSLTSYFLRGTYVSPSGVTQEIDLIT